ncbi:hypothetical protein DFH06DRAFT_1226222 [Mycena polygramma]|nr:hypothetical protein DFH06DRAFT_1226222 [Mycena polygramma]
MQLVDLGTDVLSRVFALTDVYTVLVLSQANRLLHDVGSTKQLWLSIVRDLSARRLIDALPVDVGTLSKDALVEEVRRIVRGPRTWSPETKIPPTILRRIDLEMDDSAFPELLPGGAYIVSYSAGCRRAVDCVKVATGRRTWSWSHPDFIVNSAVFDFCGASEAVVALVILTPTKDTHLLLLQANLDTGHSRHLVQMPLVPGDSSILQLLGDFVLCQLEQTYVRGTIFILLNWREEKFIVFDCTQVPAKLLSCRCILILDNSI